MNDFPFFAGAKPRVFGHRGAAGTTPENTLQSFRRAMEEGATCIEFDIHETADGEIVIIHDDEVDRTTDGHGLVGEMDVQTLKRLDAGYRATYDGGRTYPYRGRGIRIPTLEEFFESFPGVRAIVEVKRLSSEGVDRLLERIEQAGRAPDVLLAAYDAALMDGVRRGMDRRGLLLATGHSFGEIHTLMTWLWTGRRGDPPIRGQALQIPCNHQEQPLITRESVEIAHSLGLEVHVWTINDPSEMRRLVELGVDGIITDFPDRMREFVA